MVSVSLREFILSLNRDFPSVFKRATDHFVEAVYPRYWLYRCPWLNDTQNESVLWNRSVPNNINAESSDRLSPMGIYKDIQCRWVKSCSRWVKPYNSTTTTPRAILTAACVGRYDHITPIYIPPYAVPPATLIPGSYQGGVLRLDPTSTPSLK